MVPKELDKQYGKKLKQLRKKFNLQQSVLAEYLGLRNQQQYSDLERGVRHFTDDLILNICNYFHVSVMEFVENKDNSSKTNLIINPEDKKRLETSQQFEMKILIYKKLFLETKLENTLMKLRSLQKEPDKLSFHPSKHKVFVII